MKKIANEFKTFITRGNVLDMAVGVIIGGAFTGVVNGLSNYILKPIINWLIALVWGKDTLSDAAVSRLTRAFRKPRAVRNSHFQHLFNENSVSTRRCFTTPLHHQDRKIPSLTMKFP